MAPHSTSPPRWKNALRRNRFCGKQSQPFRTYSAHGSCYCRAQTREQITPCAPCRPVRSVAYCVAHDSGIWETAKSLLQGIPSHEEVESRQLSTLPMRMGGLRLQSAERCAPAAYWASWSDALKMIGERTPDVAVDVVRQLEEPGPGNGCVGELKQVASLLDRAGFWWRPSWQALREGKRVLGIFYPRLSFQEDVHAVWPFSHLPSPPPLALSHAPTTPEYTIPAHLFRVLLLERLRLPLPLTEARCTACHEPLDAWGRHRAACPHTGRLKKRAGPVERVMARICREAGARVRFNAYLWDMNVRVRADDARQIEVLAQDLPCFGGSQLAVDVTLRSALGREKPNQTPLKWTEQFCPKPAWTRSGSTRSCSRQEGVVSWWSPLRRVAGGVTKQLTSSGSWRQRRLASHHRSCAIKPLWRGREGGRGC